MLGIKVLNPVWVFEENLNRLKWWTLCTPLKKLVRGDWQTTRARALARLARPGRGRGRGCGAVRVRGAAGRAVRCDVMC
jgi:hypothetical protein